MRQTVKIEALEFELAQKRRAQRVDPEDEAPLKKRKAPDGGGRVKSEPIDVNEPAPTPSQLDTTHLGSTQSAFLSMFQSFEVAMATRSDEVEVAVAKARVRLGALETLTKALSAQKKVVPGTTDAASPRPQAAPLLPSFEHAHVSSPRNAVTAHAPPKHDSIFDRATASVEKHAPCAHEPPAYVDPTSPRPASRASSRPLTPRRSSGSGSRTQERPRARTPKRSTAEGPREPKEPPAHPTLRTLSFWFAAVDGAGMSLKRLQRDPKHRSRLANIIRALDRMQSAFDFKLMYHATTHPAAREPLRSLACRIKQLATGTVETSDADLDTWKEMVKSVPPGLLIMKNDSLLALEQAMFDDGLRYSSRLNQELRQAIVNEQQQSGLRS